MRLWLEVEFLSTLAGVNGLVMYWCGKDIGANSCHRDHVRLIRLEYFQRKKILQLVQSPSLSIVSSSQEKDFQLIMPPRGLKNVFPLFNLSIISRNNSRILCLKGEEMITGFPLGTTLPCYNRSPFHQSSNH